MAEKYAGGAGKVSVRVLPGGKLQKKRTIMAMFFMICDKLFCKNTESRKELLAHKGLRISWPLRYLCRTLERRPRQKSKP